jgi:two-component system, OmpR family, phosphate regulon response regulator PhoB
MALAQTILVVDDEPTISQVVASYLRRDGFRAVTAADGPSAVEAAREHRPDLVVLDVMLPGFDGLQVMARLRQERHVPVILLTARGEESDRVVGLRLGADDYVVKPFSVRELVLRLGVIFRARHPSPVNATPNQQRRRYVVGPLELDVDGYHVFVNGAEVHVSTLEMRLLAYLVEHRGRVRSREDLLEDVWGYKPGVSTRTIDTHVKRLRDKLGDAGALVETVRGTGYRLSADHQVVIKD